MHNVEDGLVIPQASNVGPNEAGHAPHISMNGKFLARGKLESHLEDVACVRMITDVTALFSLRRIGCTKRHHTAAGQNKWRDWL